MESSSIEYMIERNCEVTQVGGLLDDKGYGIAMRKSSKNIAYEFYGDILKYLSFSRFRVSKCAK